MAEVQFTSCNRQKSKVRCVPKIETGGAGWPPSSSAPYLPALFWMAPLGVVTALWSLLSTDHDLAALCRRLWVTNPNQIATYTFSFMACFSLDRASPKSSFYDCFHIRFFKLELICLHSSWTQSFLLGSSGHQWCPGTSSYQLPSGDCKHFRNFLSHSFYIAMIKNQITETYKEMKYIKNRSLKNQNFWLSNYLLHFLIAYDLKVIDNC